MPKLLYASAKNSDMLYATKVEIPDPFFFIDLGEKKYVFLDHREFGVFKEHNKNPDIELVLLEPLLIDAEKIKDNTRPQNKLALYLIQTYGLEKAKIQVPLIFPLDMADYLRSKKIKLIPEAPIFPQRLKKTKKEVGAIRDALVKTQEAFKYIEKVLAESRIEDNFVKYRGNVLTCDYLKDETEKILLQNKMLNIEGIIISCGEQAAIPHHRGHGPVRPRQTIVCDIFPRSIETGYFADMTRTYVKGEPSPDISEMYEAVTQSQEKGIFEARPGITGKDLHKICHNAFDDLGFATSDKGGFVHGTGHGLGLDIHEEPFVNSSSETMLEEGHVITIEPGLYYPELGGVRIEDVILITKNGSENLTDYHKNFIIP